jgi:nitronate monooxygenase
MKTWFTERFGVDLPVVGAPMFGVGAGALASAVSSAGGLGMIGVGAASSADWLSEQCRICAASGRPYGVGLMAWALERDRSSLDVMLAERPALVSVSFGGYAQFVEPLRSAGLVVTTQVGNLDETLRAEQAGVDVIVARGGEAGGHGRNDVGTLVLLQEALEAVSTPVLAAGGIATARGVAAVLAAGAVGAWIGTAFLASAEAETSDFAAAAVIEARDTDTAYGRVFDVAQRLAWPAEYGGRSLRNAYFERWHGREDDLASDDAAMQELAAAREAQDFDAAYIYAGQGAGMLAGRRSVAEIMAELATAEDLLADAAERVADR